MDSLTGLLITVGAILLVEPPVHGVARRMGLPHVTLLLLLGLAAGPLGLDLVPAEATTWFRAISEVALAMVGLLLGSEFTGARLRAHGRPVVAVSLAVTAVTWLAVALGVYAVTWDPAIALVLATASSATDPAACTAVVRDLGTGDATSQTVLGVVAIDDVYGIVLFSGVLGVLGAIAGGGFDVSALEHAGYELGGSLALGVVLGVPMAWLTGRLDEGEPTLMEGLGFVMLACGLAEWLGLSYLLVAIVMGTVVANLATHHERAFREVEHIERPFLAAFFVLSGATLQVTGLRDGLSLLAVYLGLRVLGRVLGGVVGARLGGLRQRWIGAALLPQAGVALGMTLVAVEKYPELGLDVLRTVVLATVVFELVGPLLARWTLTRRPVDAP